MTRILMIQGANMEWLGKRQPEFYGTTTADEVDAMMRAQAAERGIELEILYTNIEGEAITRIYQAVRDGYDGLLMNPAGFSHGGFALRDCILGCLIPYVEVHISNQSARGINCVMSKTADGVIYGFGVKGYRFGLDALLETVAERKANGSWPAT
ncbi:MAG: 3-dehydroquinate dehydratase [Rhodospirillaceae bacterium]|jgi:3-dehydroquinate dehydratase II|nr:3-dehydroquinate dehydratase [Rhodospirillaceae bacterium]MBT6137983.1 3-dehydroquinate dehydratase [Rhodospirillaceae bacterium]